MEHIGIGQCDFFKFIQRAMDMGQVTITGAQGLSDVFHTTRGIRQGCPASPLLFALLISFIEFRLCRMFPDAGVKIGQSQKLFTNYADDIKLICSSPQELSAIYSELRRCLAALGLVCEGSNCRVLIINGND